jgi:hypothetical protein
MYTEEEYLISLGKLFHRYTILLKYEFLKRVVLHRFGRRKSPVLERVALPMTRSFDVLINVKIIQPRFAFIIEHYQYVLYFQPI